MVSSSSLIADSITCKIKGDNFKVRPEPGFLAIVPLSLKRLRKIQVDYLEMRAASSKTKISAIFDILKPCQCKLSILNLM